MALTVPGPLPRDLAAAAPRGAATETALRLRSVEHIDSRHLALEVYSPAMGRLMKIRVLLPRNYHSSTRRYPVLYMHHGGGGDERRWTAKTRIEQYTQKRDVIVVMPSAAQLEREGLVLGWYSNWYSKDGRYRWETYHLDELIEFVDNTYRTVPSRSGRAVAGLSMGGFGALNYATRRPDLFAAVASFAGVPDHVTADAGAGESIAGAEVWGPYSTQEVRHRGHNPRDLMTNLRGMDVWLTCGVGPDSKEAQKTATDPSTATEAALFVLNQNFSTALDQAGIPHEFKVREGNHQWRYWDVDVKQWLPHVMDVFAQQRTVRRPPAYRSTDRLVEVWGWRLETVARPREFLEVARLGRGGFNATGSGALRVRTPAYYQPGRLLRVGVLGRNTRLIRVDEDGRLLFRVDFGNRHQYQQFTREADVEQAAQGASYFRTLRVRITAP